MTTTATPPTAPDASSDGARFWCHECACHVATREADDGSGELCCAACGGNFVEQVEAVRPRWFPFLVSVEIAWLNDGLFVF
jgi:hypothetical protein